MSHRVDARDVAAEGAARPFAYLISVAADGYPHPLACSPEVAGDDLVIDGVGHRTLANCARRPQVTLAWPPAQRDGYSLIVDAQARCEGSRVVLSHDGGVLHRPAPARGADAASC